VVVADFAAKIVGLPGILINKRVAQVDPVVVDIRGGGQFEG